MSELEIINCEQNSPEWSLARAGIVTASCFKDVMAKGQGKMRRNYLLRIVGERLSGQPFESYYNRDMERGHALEDDARDEYCIETGHVVERIGFMRRGEVGYSPDALIGDDGLLEIKTKDYHLHLECILENRVPPEHMKQLQGGLWVSARQWIDFCSYSPGLTSFIQRVYRDETMIARIKVEVEEFLADVHKTIEQVKGYKRAA